MYREEAKKVVEYPELIPLAIKMGTTYDKILEQIREGTDSKSDAWEVNQDKELLSI